MIVGMLTVGVSTGELPRSFLNWHAVIIVIVGTSAAILVNSPMKTAIEALFAGFSLFGGERYGDQRRIITAVAALAGQFQSRGIAALMEADPRVMKGYLNRAAKTAGECNDPEVFEQILENEINHGFDHQNEVINVYRTAGIVASMFGLLGTLLGIVRVLRQIANPQEVGPAMATAITTAFYGIALGNVFCVPIAGKLRIRYIQEKQAKALVAEGLGMMLRGSVPAVIERKLLSYL